jgi:hypothetical protein
LTTGSAVRSARNDQDWPAGHRSARASSSIRVPRETLRPFPKVDAFDFDPSVVMNGNDLHFDDRLLVLVRFLRLDPVHEVAGTIRPAGTIPRHCSTPERSGLHCGRRSCQHRLVPAASSPGPPASVGLVCAEPGLVGASREAGSAYAVTNVFGLVGAAPSDAG